MEKRFDELVVAPMLAVGWKKGVSAWNCPSAREEAESGTMGEAVVR